MRTYTNGKAQRCRRPSYKNSSRAFKCTVRRGECFLYVKGQAVNINGGMVNLTAHANNRIKVEYKQTAFTGGSTAHTLLPGPPASHCHLQWWLQLTWLLRGG